MNTTNPHPKPTKDWTLEMWREAADPDFTGPRWMERASALAARLDIDDSRDPFRQVNARTYYDWKDKGVPNRTNALVMLAALGIAARKNDVNLLNGALLREHARIFLQSLACESKWAELSQEELKKLSPPKPSFVTNNFAEQERDVRPAAPAKLFGRDQDMERVLYALQNSPICVVDSVGGNGKTSLAWFATQRAVQNGIVQQFSWSTDKRLMIDPNTGVPVDIPAQSLDFTRILRSMAARFNWLEIATSADDRELEELCAERLQRGFYLVIIDNLETMSQYNEVIERLTTLLRPRQNKALQSSHALITSREQVNVSGAYRVAIEGLSYDASHQMIRFTEPALLGQRINPLSDSQIETLWKATSGNPLFINIAMSRYKVEPREFDSIIDQLNTGTNFFGAFDNLFGDLFSSLSEEARWLAFTAVKYPVILFKNLLDAYLTAGGNREGFDIALQQLVELSVLDALSNGTAEYVFHPLIKAYVLRKKREIE